MMFQIVPISQLNEGQIKELARLHEEVMHSLLSDLGLPFVERYYQIAHVDSSVIGACVLGVDGNLRGWAVGSPKPNQVNRRMREAWGWFFIQIIRVLFTRPRLILQLVASASTASIELKEGAIELTYIGVDESARKQGLGRELLHAFVQAAHGKGFHSVELSVEADNADAIALYTRVGFEVVSSFNEGAFNRHRMELKL